MVRPRVSCGPAFHLKGLFQKILFKSNLDEISDTSAVPAAAFPALSSHELPVASDMDSAVLNSLHHYG